MITKHLQIKFDMTDPHQRELCKAVGKLPRGIKGTFIVQLLSSAFGVAKNEELRRRMLDFVYRRDRPPLHVGAAEEDALESGHKKHDAESEPLSPAPRSEPLSPPPKNKRIGRPPKSEPLKRQQKAKRTSSDEEDALMC